jgi:hypothetical protein
MKYGVVRTVNMPTDGHNVAWIAWQERPLAFAELHHQRSAGTPGAEGPQGIAGPDGPAGPQGAAGPQGEGLGSGSMLVLSGRHTTAAGYTYVGKYSLLPALQNPPQGPLVMHLYRKN